MDGPIEHSDSDSGDSWTILENSVFADDAPDFSEITLESPAAEKHEKDEDTDGISVISDSEPDSHSPFLINYETVFESNRPPEHDTAQYMSVNPHLSNLQTDTKSVRDDDILGDNKQKNKTYVHRRNKRLSSVLNIVVMASVITAAGVAIGHMWGAKTDCTLHNTPGVNKILSNLYRLQEENAYLREKLREITVLTNYQANYHKAQIKHNKCKKVFEESLHSNNNKPTACVNDQYDDLKLPKNPLLYQSHERDFGSNVNKLEDTYQENRSWIDESIKRLKLENKPLEKTTNPSNSHLTRPKQSYKLKYSANVISKIEETLNDNIVKIADDIQKTPRYSNLLKSSIDDDTADKKIKNMDNVEKDFYNKKQKIGNEIKKQQDNTFKISDKNKKFNKRESDIFMAHEDSTKPKFNKRDSDRLKDIQIDSDINFFKGNDVKEDKKFNKRDRNELFEPEADLDKPVSPKREFTTERDYSFKIHDRIDKRFNKRDRDRILYSQSGSDIEFFNENDTNEGKSSTKTNKKESLDAESELNEPVNLQREFSPDNNFSFKVQRKKDKKFNNKDRDIILDTQINSDIEFFKENNMNEYGESTKRNPQLDFHSDTIFFSNYDIKEEKRENPGSSFKNDGKTFTQKYNKYGKMNDNDTKNKKFFKRQFALKEEIDKSKLKERIEIETDSFIGDNVKDNRFMGQKPKQNRKQNDRPKPHKKEKRRNKYEQWEMKGGLLKDYDDISFASSQDSGILVKDFKGEVENDFVYVPNDFDMYSEEKVDDDDNKKGCYVKKNGKDRNLHWLDKRAISRKEARRQLEKELFDRNVNTAEWHFRRMRKREQCRAKGDNSTYRKLSKRFKNFKTKQ